MSILRQTASNEEDTAIKMLSFGENRVRYKIKVGDLDLKPISKISFHFELDKKIEDHVSSLKSGSVL